MTTHSTLTAEMFAAEFPHARGHKDALRYAVVAHHPKTIIKARDIPVGINEIAVEVGYTNISNSKKLTRFAIVASDHTA